MSTTRRDQLPPEAEHIMGLLRGVIDPELGSDIVELGMAKGATVDADGTVHVRIALDHCRVPAARTDPTRRQVAYR